MFIAIRFFFNLEYDTISDNKKIRYKSKESDYSFGINFQPNSKLTFGLNYERGSNILPYLQEEPFE